MILTEFIAVSFFALSEWITGLFLLGMAFTVFTKLVSGRINTRHLLEQLRPDGTYVISSGRVQLLLFTLLVAGKYLYDTYQAMGAGHLPDVPNETLVMLSGSHAVYLGGKMYSTFFSSIRNTGDR